MSKANTKEQEPKEQKSMAREILEMVFYLVIALLAALFIVNFVGQRTPGGRSFHGPHVGRRTEPDSG